MLMPVLSHPVSLLLVLLRTHCQAIAHWFVEEAGGMKHKEEGYRLFPDDHVWMVGFPPGFAIDIHCLFHGIVKPSFKTTGNNSTVAALSKISG